MFPRLFVFDPSSIARPDLPRRQVTTRTFAAFALVGLLAACQRDPAPAADPVPTEPTAAVMQLVDDLRRNDLVAYARHAVPPALHARLETAWREGRTTWPLTELPLEEQLPAFISLLAAPDAEKTLLASYNRQFAGADRELRSAASTLGLFAAQYANSEADYSDAERDHYVQLIQALSAWGQRAPLGDAQRIRIALPQLVAAARRTGLAGPDALVRTGMVRSLQRLGPFFARFKQVLVGYGLDLDSTLAGVEATLMEQTGDTARVRLRYTVAGQAIDAIVLTERRDGRWYLTDALRHAEAQSAAVAIGTTPPQP